MTSSSNLVIDNGYALSSGTPAPITLGSATSIVGSAVNTWHGAVDTDWFTAGNWSDNSVPTSTDNCDIATASNLPTIGAGTATCARMRFYSGTLTMTNGVGANLEIYEII